MAGLRALRVPGFLGVFVLACNDSGSSGSSNVQSFCSSDKDCRASASLCDEERSLCVECVRNVDCLEGEVCLGDLCRGSCTNSLDCDSDEVCDEDENVCVGCVADSDCPGDERCVQAACVGECESDDDCVSGAFCDAGLCLIGLCEPGDSACEDGELYECNDARNAFQRLGCDAACDDSRVTELCSDEETQTSGSTTSSGTAGSGGSDVNVTTRGITGAGSGGTASGGSGSGGDAGSSGNTGSGGDGGSGGTEGSTGGAGSGGDASSAGGVSGAAGNGGSGGTPSTGGSGGLDAAGGNGGAPSTTGAGGSSGETGTCTAPMVDAGSEGNFFLNTVDAICVRYSRDIQGWYISSFDGRTFTVNGEEVQPGGALPPKLNGYYYYFDISAGEFEWAAISVW